MPRTVRVVMRANSRAHKVGEVVEVDAEQAKALIANSLATKAPSERKATKASSKAAKPPAKPIED